MKFPPSITKKYVSAGRSPATTKPDIHLNNAELRDTHKRACLTNSKGKNELDFPPQKKTTKNHDTQPSFNTFYSEAASMTFNCMIIVSRIPNSRPPDGMSLRETWNIVSIQRNSLS